MNNSRLSYVDTAKATLLIYHLIDNSLFAKYGQMTLPIYAFHLLVVDAVSIVYKHSIVLYINSYDLNAIVVGTLSLILTCILILFVKSIDSNLIGEHK